MKKYKTKVISTKAPDESTQSAVIPQATDEEMKTETNPDSSILNNRSTVGSPKRPNDGSPNVKKKVLGHFSHRVALYSFLTSWAYVFDIRIDISRAVGCLYHSIPIKCNLYKSVFFFFVCFFNPNPSEKKEKEEKKESVGERFGSCVFNL